MKKTLLITGVLLALTASVASAAGINLYWTGCSLDGGTTNRNFACNTNSGNAGSMTASFDPPAGLGDVNGNNLILDLQTAAAVLPPWWDMSNLNVTFCRQAISANTVFAIGNCADPWGGGSPGITAYIKNFGGNANRVRIGGSVSVATGGPTAAGTEYYSININISNTKTVGSPNCAGCNEPVCIVLNEIKITQPSGTSGGSPQVTSPLTSNFVTANGGVIGGAGCPGATPAVNRTWGQVKSIYR
jgi:hypothetical protein